MDRFEVLDHTADLGLVAWGKDLKEAFANMAFGMFSQIASLDKVAEKASRTVKVDAPDREALLVAWLNELLYLLDAQGLLLKRFDILELSDRHLKAEVKGEKADPQKHDLKTAIKAATYHMLKIEQRGDGFRAQVIFDI